MIDVRIDPDIPRRIVPFTWIALFVALMQLAVLACGLMHLTIDHSRAKSQVIELKQPRHDHSSEEHACSICKYLAHVPMIGGALETPADLPTFEASRETRIVLRSIERNPPLTQSTPTCGPPSTLIKASMEIFV